jgi:hypothetical protein
MSPFAHIVDDWRHDELQAVANALKLARRSSWPGTRDNYARGFVALHVQRMKLPRITRYVFAGRV